MISLKSNLSTRLYAQKIFHQLLKEKITELDFTNVNIISRSFANEFIKLERENNLEITKKNMNKDIKFMFEISDKILDSDILSDNKYSTTSVEKYADMI